MTLDDFVAARVTPAGQHVRLVKLDVEGHAGAALRGARRLLASRQVAEWFVGVHSREEDTQVRRSLQEAGYVVRTGPPSKTNPQAFLHAVTQGRVTKDDETRSALKWTPRGPRKLVKAN